jgi:import inner membrane translocase subunit TIM13
MDQNQLANLTPAQREEVMQTVQQQVALANMQELLVKVTDKCFKKCITSPGSSMGSSDQKCVAMCMDRYMDSFNLVSKAYTRRLQQEM